MPPANCVAIFLSVLKVHEETNVSLNSVFGISGLSQLNP